MFKSVKNIFFVQADVQGYGWRASYVLSALPGFIVGILLATTVKDPFTGYTTAAGSRYSQRLWIEAVVVATLKGQECVFRKKLEKQQI